MSKLTLHQKGKLFANDILQFFKYEDFEDTPENGNSKEKTEVSYVKNGKYYNIRWLYFPPCGAFSDGLIEARVKVDSENPEVRQYTGRIQETCWVYYYTPEKRRKYGIKGTNDCYVIDNYYVNYYRRMQMVQEFCIYCDCRCLCHTRSNKNHNKTMKHITNVKKCILNLANLSKLPESVVIEIMSYIYV